MQSVLAGVRKFTVPVGVAVARGDGRRIDDRGAEGSTGGSGGCHGRRRCEDGEAHRVGRARPGVVAVSRVGGADLVGPRREADRVGALDGRQSGVAEIRDQRGREGDGPGRVGGRPVSVRVAADPEWTAADDALLTVMEKGVGSGAGRRSRSPRRRRTQNPSTRRTMHRPRPSSPTTSCAAASSPEERLAPERRFSVGPKAVGRASTAPVADRPPTVSSGSGRPHFNLPWKISHIT